MLTPPFCQLAKVLTKIAVEGARVVLCTPERGSIGEQAYWSCLLYCMTVGRTELPDGPIYVLEDSEETVAAPEWGSLWSIMDGCLNSVPVCDLEQEVLKELMAGNGGISLLDLKKRSEYSSVTTTSGERYDDQETLAASPPMADARDNVSEIASSIPPVNSDVLTLKHSTFLAQLLMEEVDLTPTHD